MPRKTKTPEVKVLLRDNQRRSRARRKELIEDMQQRLQRYEHEGVQASLAMQSAARAVVAENRCLRALLARHGVLSDEIEACLRKGGVAQGSQSAVMQPTSPLRLVHHTGGHDVAILAAPGASDVSNHGRQRTDRCLGQVEMAGDDEREPQYSSHGEDDLPLQGDRDATRAEVPEYQSPTPPRTHMACDIAATIVADLHGHGDPRLARSSLGCTTDNCSVRTTQVFSIIDKAT